MAEDEHSPLHRASWRELARVMLALVVVAVGAAAFAMAFRAGTQLVYGTLYGARDVLEVFTRLPLAARVALPAFGGLLAGLVARAAARSPGQGVGEVMEAVVLGGTRLSVRATAWKALGSWLAIVTGNSVGREGPLIQFGGALGAGVASAFRIPGHTARALIAAGTAAGFAAAYNTPLAAVLFVVEIVTGVVVIDALGMVLIATAISTALVRASVGGGPIYGQRAFSTTTTRELVAYAALGVLAALVGQGFMRLLGKGERLFAHANVPQPWRAALGGVIVGVMAVWLPQVTGNGYEPLNVLLDEHYAVGLVAVARGRQGARDDRVRVLRQPGRRVHAVALHRRRHRPPLGTRGRGVRRRSGLRGRVRAGRDGRDDRGDDARAADGVGARVRALRRLRDRAAARARHRDRDDPLAAAQHRLDLHGRAAPPRPRVGDHAGGPAGAAKWRRAARRMTPQVARCVNALRVMNNLRTYGLAAAGAAGAAAAFELVRVIANGGAALGQNALSSFIMAFSFSIVLAVAAVGLVAQRSFGWIAGIGGAVVALSYGIVLRAAGNLIGIPYMFLGILLFGLLVKSMPHYRTVAPA